jgi:homoserine kinase type II
LLFNSWTAFRIFNSCTLSMATEECPTYSVLDPAVYLDWLARWYPCLGTPRALRVISGGLANSNYQLATDRGVYLLKICDEKSYEELLVQAAVLEALRELGFRCPYVHPHGERQRLPAQRHRPTDCVLRVTEPAPLRMMVYDFLEGAPGAAASFTVVAAEQLGEGLAQLHAVDRQQIALPLPSYPLGLEVIAAFLDARRQATPVRSPDEIEFEEWLQAHLADFAPLFTPATGLPQGLIHGDLFPDNAMFSATDQLVGILDLEEISWGPLVLDVGMTIVGCAYPQANTLSWPHVRAILRGYERVRPLTADERPQLPSAIRFAALSIAFWRYRQFNVRHPELNKQQAYRVMFDRARQVPDQFWDLLDVESPSITP